MMVGARAGAYILCRYIVGAINDSRCHSRCIYFQQLHMADDEYESKCNGRCTYFMKVHIVGADNGGRCHSRCIYISCRFLAGTEYFSRCHHRPWQVGTCISYSCMAGAYIQDRCINLMQVHSKCHGRCMNLWQVLNMIGATAPVMALIIFSSTCPAPVINSSTCHGTYSFQRHLSCTCH